MLNEVVNTVVHNPGETTVTGLLLIWVGTLVKDFFNKFLPWAGGLFMRDKINGEEEKKELIRKLSEENEKRFKEQQEYNDNRMTQMESNMDELRQNYTELKGHHEDCLDENKAMQLRVGALDKQVAVSAKELEIYAKIPTAESIAGAVHQILEDRKSA